MLDHKPTLNLFLHNIHLFVFALEAKSDLAVQFNCDEPAIVLSFTLITKEQCKQKLKNDPRHYYSPNFKVYIRQEQ